MTALPQKTSDTNVPTTPVHALQSLFTKDMKAVNTHIMENMQSDVPLIPELASYLIAAGGKRLRPLLVLAATSLMDGSMERAHKLAAAVEFIHTATLLHDDVVDHSEKRRGKESANLAFGNEASVLVGDFLFSRAFQLMVADGSLETLRILSDASAIIAEGEVKQLSIQSDVSASLNDYLSVIEGKTASLFAAACEVGPVIAESSQEQQKALRDFGYNLGMSFQISDDILDYDPERSKLGKRAGDDFAEGKMTAPILFALENATAEEKEFWNRTLTKDQQDGDFEKALAIIHNHDALTKSRDLAHSYHDKAIASLDILESSDLKTLLTDLSQFVVNRTF